MTKAHDSQTRVDADPTRELATSAAMSSATAPPSSFRWDRLTVAMTCVNCLLISALGSGLVLPELREQFHLSGIITALHGSMFGVGLLCFGVFGVRVVGRLGRHRSLVASAVGIALGVTIFIFGPAWPVTLLGMTIAGLGAALLVTIGPAIVSDHHGPNRAAAFSALAAVPGFIGLTLSAAVGLTLGSGGSWRVPYFVFTAIVFVVAATVGRSVRVPAGEPMHAASLRRLTERMVLVPWLQLILAILTDFSIGIWSVTYLREVGGASAGAAPILGCVFGITMSLSRLWTGRIRHRLGAWTVPVGYLLAAVGVSLLCFVPVLWVRVAALGLFAFGTGPLYPLAIDRLYERTEHAIDPVTIATLCALGNGLAVIVGPLALGALADVVELRWAVLVALALSVLGVFTHLPRRRY